MEPVLSVRGMDKTFGATIALRQVDIDVYPGEIRGLIGENGSGKSTLTSIIAGIQKADAGEVTFHGKPWQPASMIDALEHGIGMIVQETGTIPGITVAENLFLGETSRFHNKLGLVSRKAMEQEARKALDVIHADHIRPDIVTAMLDLQERKLVEVAKVMVKKPEILVVDETTTALSQKGRELKGRELLYQLMNNLKKEGRAVIFISHDLDEIKQVCDTLTVLRDGKIITHFSKENYDDDAIKASMIGREMQGDYYRPDNEPTWQEKVLLKAEHLTGSGLKDISLEIRAGEILGIGGLSECGMHTLGKALFGSAMLTGGTVTVEGKHYSDPQKATRLGVGYVSKERDTESLCQQASIRDNIAIGGLQHIQKKKLILKKCAKASGYAEHQMPPYGAACQCYERRQQAEGGLWQVAWSRKPDTDPGLPHPRC